MLDEITQSKIFKASLIILVFIGVVLLLFTYGMNFYNRVRCSSVPTIKRMTQYCVDNAMELRYIRYEDGLCIAVCGR